MKSIIAAAAALAVTTQAFLVPATVKAPAEPMNPFLVGVGADQNAVIELPCPGCPVQVTDRHGNVRVKTNKPNHLSLLFKIESQEGVDSLVVNGMQLYPHSYNLKSTFAAPQTIERHPHRKQDANWSEKHHKDRKGQRGPSHHKILNAELGYSLVSVRQADSVALELQINKVGDQFVEGIPSVKLILAVREQDQLAIDDIRIDRSSTLYSHPLPGQHCGRWCQWLKTISKFGKPTGNCADKNKQGARPPVVLPSHHKYRPGHMHRPQRTWAQLVRNIASHILFPILVGIVAGVSASLIGMMAGTFVVMVWRTLFRKQHSRCRSGCRNRAARKEAGIVEEKAGLLDEQGPPPAYEEGFTPVEAQDDVQETVPEPVQEDVKEDVPKA